jgi:hypothetical protein
MNEQVQHHDTHVIEQAMAAFLLDAVNAKGKSSRIKANMECRRKLEIKWEEKRLARETSEFDFN